MTVATVATGPAAGGTGAAAGGTAARTRGVRPSQQKPPGSRGTRPSQQKPPPTPQQRRAQQRKKRQEFARKHVPRKPVSRNNYQAVILAEFVAAILLTAMTPVATKKDTQGLSPYAGSDIVKLGAITLVYLILAMISVGGQQAGRVAAWLGGLVLLTDGLFEASNIAKDLQAFSGGGSPDVTKPKAKAA